MKYKAVIFDCDGTLISSEHSYFLSFKHAMEKRGIEFTSDDFHTYVGKPDDTCLHLLGEKYGKDRADEIYKDITAYNRTLKHTPIDATMEFLHNLQREKEKLGIKLGLASAADRCSILSNLQFLGVEHYFDVILSGHEDLHSHYEDQDGVNKPKPYIYQHAAKLLNVSPCECVAIEDSHTGVSAGVDAGCYTVAIPNSYTKYHDLSHAHLILDSLANISIENFFTTLLR